MRPSWEAGESRGEDFAEKATVATLASHHFLRLGGVAAEVGANRGGDVILDFLCRHEGSESSSTCRVVASVDLVVPE